VTNTESPHDTDAISLASSGRDNLSDSPLFASTIDQGVKASSAQRQAVLAGGVHGLDSFILDASMIQTPSTETSHVATATTSAVTDDPPPFAREGAGFTLLRTSWNSSTALSSLALSATHLMASSTSSFTSSTSTASVPSSQHLENFQQSTIDTATSKSSYSTTVTNNSNPQNHRSIVDSTAEDEALAMSLRDIVRNHFNPLAFFGRETPPPPSATTTTTTPSITIESPPPSDESMKDGQVVTNMGESQKDSAARTSNTKTTSSSSNSSSSIISQSQRILSSLWNAIFGSRSYDGSSSGPGDL
jgi:hypothetical protein